MGNAVRSLLRCGCGCAFSCCFACFKNHKEASRYSQRPSAPSAMVRPATELFTLSKVHRRMKQRVGYGGSQSIIGLRMTFSCHPCCELTTGIQSKSERSDSDRESHSRYSDAVDAPLGSTQLSTAHDQVSLDNPLRSWQTRRDTLRISRCDGNEELLRLTRCQYIAVTSEWQD